MLFSHNVSIHSYSDRADAGKILAKELSSFKGQIETIILALPRGGMPVAYEVAKALSLSMDIWLVRKLGFPGHEELAIGAIASGGITVINEDLVRRFNIDQRQIAFQIKQEQIEMERRNELYRRGRKAPNVNKKTVIVIDDGLATGATMKAAVESLRKAGASWIVVAVPVGARTSCTALIKKADEVVCLMQPEPFYSVGEWYDTFLQVSDNDVVNLLDSSRTVPAFDISQHD
jgi:predicted phosphoribosyltransferase